MAKSVSLSPFRSSKGSASPTPQAAKQTHQPGHAVGAAANPESKKKASTRERLNFFRRVSSRMSSLDTLPSDSHSAKHDILTAKESSSDKTNTNRIPPPPARQPRHSSSIPDLSLTETIDGNHTLYPTDSLALFKDTAQTPSDSPSHTKPRSSRASLFFWKRASQTHGTAIQPVENRSQRRGGADPVPSSASSDGAPSSIVSSEISETASSAYGTTETSVLGSVEEQDKTQDVGGGMAGIGVRNRNSVSSHSLPVRYSLSPNASPSVLPSKVPYHPGLKYAPSNSSPLSSRPHSPAEPLAGSSTISNLNPGNRASSYRSSTPTPSINRQSLLQDSHRLSTGRLNIVPTQTCIGSEELMRILRGPSSYPEESLPRSSDASSLYLCV